MTDANVAIALPSAEARKTLDCVVDLCATGWRTGDRKIYELIAAKLEKLEQTEELAAIVRLAQGGGEFSSARFAFPHIEDRVRDILAGGPR